MTLAQTGPAPDAQQVPMLPEPPLLAHYLLENPWPLAAGLICGGLFALFVLNTRGRAKDGLRLLALGVTLALAVIGVSLAVTTEREVLQARTTELIHETAAARITNIRPLLSEHITVKAFAVVPSPKGRDAVLESVRANLGEQYPLKEHTLGSVRAVIDGPNVARTQVRVWAKFDKSLYDAAIGAWFRLDWTRDGEGPWRVTNVTVLQIDGLGVNSEAGR